MEKIKLPEYASYAAGATRTRLKVFAEEKTTGYSSSCTLYARRARVGKHEGGRHLFVFVNESCPVEEAEVAIILQKGYSFSKAETSPCEPIVWATSDATCESGVLMVVPFGFEYAVAAYKNRGPRQYYRVTKDGTKNITSEVAANKQQPI